MTWCIEREEIASERLLLRPFRAEDAETVQGHVSLWAIARMTTRIPHPYPDSAAAEWIASHATFEAENGETVFCIADGGRVIGAISLRRKNPGLQDPDTAEIGYWLAPGHWGRGYATEAARALLAYAFEEPRLHAVTSGHFGDNPASGRVLAKCGFQPTGDEREWSAARQDFVACKRFVLERAVWHRLDLAS